MYKSTDYNYSDDSGSGVSRRLRSRLADFESTSSIPDAMNSPNEQSIEVQLNNLDSELNPQMKEKNRPPSVYKSKVFIVTLAFSATLLTLLCIAFMMNYEKDSDVASKVSFWNVDLPPEQKIWYDKGIDELKEALHHQINMRRAKNVILFIGDGMGPNTVTASRIYGFKEEGLLSWEKFPHMGLLKTYCANKQVPDSFSTATALFGGVKVNYETGGVDSTVNLANCTAAMNATHHVETILKWAQDDGMNTGFVTTTRVTHATPAALYAHVPDRRWECEAKVPEDARHAGCKDIGKILIEENPGKSINVIMGGGRQCLVSHANSSDADPLDTWACNSKDGRNLIHDWEVQKNNAGESSAVVQNNEELANLNGADVDYVLGIFANGHLKYDHERDSGPKGMPSLKDMTLKALEVLKTKPKGFLLVVEGGNIDQAHHRGAARKALSEVLALNEAIEATVKDMSDHLAETLIIVTADHSHTLTINGYPDKGNNILGIASNSKTESTPYTTLTYGTGYNAFQPELDPQTNKMKRRDPSKDDTTSFDYVQQATINTDENTHGGSDTTIFAKGPMAHLFHNVHEQSYVAHVISYALRIGRFRDSSIVESLAEMLPI
ncbi:alkaline phosphatase isoform X1 [Eupeodes corollae]|uniref:alkaline phosphatase isoform X1 n=2 Tax=Eupeodes corollae TaxID=290404 RepID=UPI002492CB29|nr:alkaline phosphatase isoform X1 [Eupeodes corollae]